MKLEITLNNEPLKDISFELYPIENTIKEGLVILKKMGEFAPLDTDGWLSTAENEVWNELSKFKRI